MASMLLTVADNGALSKAFDLPLPPGEITIFGAADLVEGGPPEVVVALWDDSGKHTRWLRAANDGINSSSWDVPGTALGCADFDDDGHLDVIVAGDESDWRSHELRVYRGDGNGGLVLALKVDVSEGGEGTEWRPGLVCDYDGDGLADIGTYSVGYHSLVLNVSQ